MNHKTVARSCIYIDERVPNTQRRFGQAPEYVPAYLVRIGHKPVALLLTLEQIRDAKVRAEGNPEDCPPFQPEEVRIDRAAALARKDERAQVVASMLAERKGIERRAFWSGWVAGTIVAMVAAVVAVLL